MNPVRRAEFLIALPRLRAQRSLQAVRELAAVSPHVDEDTRRDIIREWEREARPPWYEPPKRQPGSMLDEHRRQLASMGIVLQEDAQALRDGHLVDLMNQGIGPQQMPPPPTPEENAARNAEAHRAFMARIGAPAPEEP